MTLGAWRRAAGRARAKVWVSEPTSRWLMVAFWWGWRYSMGSSMVMTWMLFSELILLMMAARVVDFPEPVGPVTRTIPFRSFAISLSWDGIPSSSMLGTRFGITRSAIEKQPRWENTFARKRVRRAQLEERANRPGPSRLF